MGNPLVRFYEGQGYNQNRTKHGASGATAGGLKTDRVRSRESPVYSKATWQWLHVEEGRAERRGSLPG